MAEPGFAFPSDLTCQMAVLQLLLPLRPPIGRRPSWLVWEIVNAIFYVLPGGVNCCMLPPCDPPSSRDAKQVRRLLAVVAIYKDENRSEAAWISGVTLQIARDWVVRFNAESPAGLVGWWTASSRVAGR